ncbi:unknown similar to AMEV003 [Adoxophyes honmai entomopoxvirus 'L']|uniref:Uncharacterized protein n=1 Tax=Adoxophyes honmai entomopoxvirus 'L' TaxID=1293540 RepID=A0A916KNV8_9POXV|nr:unknown similar to AMEV003 [Adoxophyes honmai entomopoxvirus 'L']CCU55344.1 unknown similar to AMEV003 [Adoxophyes honmai entomopoxvirus 'L']
MFKLIAFMCMINYAYSSNNIFYNEISDYNNINDLYYINTVFKNIKKSDYLKYDIKFGIMLQIKKICKYNKLIEQQNITPFIIFVNNIFDIYKSNNYTTFMDDILYFQEFSNNIPKLFINNMNIIKTFLRLYSHYRNDHNKYDIDNAVLQMIKNVIDYPFYFLNKKELKNVVYLEYVKYINIQDRHNFYKYYNIVDINILLPNKILYEISDKIYINFKYDNLKNNTLNISILNDIYINFNYSYTILNIIDNIEKNITFIIFNNINDYNVYYDIFASNINDTIVYTYYDMMLGRISKFNFNMYYSLSLAINRNLPYWFVDGISKYEKTKCYEYNNRFLKNEEFKISNVLSNIITKNNEMSVITNFLLEKYPSILNNILNNIYIYKHDINVEIQFESWKNNTIQICKDNADMYESDDFQDDYSEPIKNIYSRTSYDLFDNEDDIISIEFYDHNHITFILTKYNIYALSDTNDNKYIYNNMSFNKNLDLKYIISSKYDYDFLIESIMIKMYNNLISKQYMPYIFKSDLSNLYNISCEIFYNKKIINNIKINTPLYNFICRNNFVCNHINEKIISNNLDIIINNKTCEYVKPIFPLINITKDIKNFIYDVIMEKNININVIKNFDLQTYIDLYNNTLFELSITYNNKELYDYIVNKNISFNHYKYRYLCTNNTYMPKFDHPKPVNNIALIICVSAIVIIISIIIIITIIYFISIK